MSVETEAISNGFADCRPGLIYDADSVTLVGKFGDELSAYRAKRKWLEILSAYFLLEPERDYDVWVTANIDTSSYLLGCTFVSACGRYAFWRLINHQAPEAETRLGEGISSNPARRLLSRTKDGEEKRSAWVFSALNHQIDENEDTKGLINRIMRLFQ